PIVYAPRPGLNPDRDGPATSHAGTPASASPVPLPKGLARGEPAATVTSPFLIRGDFVPAGPPDALARGDPVLPPPLARARLARSAHSRRLGSEVRNSEFLIPNSELPAPFTPCPAPLARIRSLAFSSHVSSTSFLIPNYRRFPRSHRRPPARLPRFRRGSRSP